MTQTKTKAIAPKERTKLKPNYPRIIRDMLLILTFSCGLVFGVNYFFFPDLWARNSTPNSVEVAPGHVDHGSTN